jgi:NAD(P)-dependent dehydrogenase (short-subunit alcohol dehydrogenase family)
MSGLKGKSIIITGGGSGIGRSAVEILCGEGALVTIADLNEAGGNEVAAIANGGNGKAQFVRTDVSNEDSVRAMVGAAVDRFGRLDGAINAAGVVQHWKLIHEISAAEWDFVVNINLRGMFFCLKHQIAAMLKTGGGSIVAIASIAATLGLANSGEYCASKAGVTGLVRAAATDYAKSGIRVNALLPGATATPMVERALANKPKDLGGALVIPNGRMADPSEIAHGAVWMVSDQSTYMSGSCVTIDAGLSIA